jgi:lysophospholipase L1-like esterase
MKPSRVRRIAASQRRNAIEPYRSFQTAIAKRESAAVDIVCIGDSLTEGADVTNIEKRWVARLRDKLRAFYPTPGVTGGQGYICANYYVIGNASVPQQNQVFTQTGGTTDASYQTGLGRRFRRLSQAGDKLNITVTCSSVDVVYTKGTGRGVLGLSIDGGSVTTVNTSGGAVSGSKFSSGALTPGSHAIEITWVSGGNVDVEGMMVYNGDENAGIRIWEGGHGGVKSDFYTAGTQSWIETIHQIQPDHLFIELGANDWFYNSGVVAGSYGSFPPSFTQTNIEDLVGDLRTKCTVPPSITLIIAHARGDASPTVGQVPLEVWDAYVDVYYAIAAADPSIGIIDMNTAMGPQAWVSGQPSYGLLSTDKVHINDSGSELYANTIFRAITAQGLV